MIIEKIILIIILLISFEAQAQTQSKNYDDGHGRKVYLPLGDISFADQVVKFTPGNPAAIEQASNPSASLGIPDFDGGTKGFVSLGCGGVLILKFTNNSLVNIDGPDLYIFEMGKFIESTELSISKDGVNWISIGEIEGAKAEVDIEKFTAEGDVFNYVRLVDLKSECRGMWPGADIDAVAAIGSAKRISLTGNILFNFNESVLKQEAKKSLDALVKEINESSITNILVEGYTDSLGSTEFNKKLSLARALSVKTYLTKNLKNKNHQINAVGLGESNPRFPNDTKEGQEKNRRVEVILLPLKK